MRISETQALAEILNRQAETAEELELTELRPRIEAYARGEKWREEDAALVWSSPTARRFYLDARRRVLAEIEQIWSDKGFDEHYFRRAADDGDRGELVLGEAGVTIRILHAPASGDWLISVVLTPDALALLPSGTKVRITDTAGFVWLTGEPDRDGGVDAYWEGAESPLVRLREHSLSLGFL